MKNNLYENFEERELRKIQAECDRYGYHAFLQFDEIHIRTKGEEWYFVPANIHGGMITLMHRSSGIQDKYHRQFQRRLSYEQLIDYVHEHEQYRLPFTGVSALELFFSYILLIAGGNINETNNFNFHDSIIRIFHNMGSKNEASNKPTGKCERRYGNTMV